MTERNSSDTVADGAKRVFDVAVSAMGIVITAPVILATAVAVAASMGRPILFRQKRPGKDGRIFELVKFRSMRERDSVRMTDAQRLTPTGRFLRSTSLDELPTLWNVLRGDMSLVGPRPLLVEYLSKYTPEQARRHEVRPGVTGLAQISGRNCIGWDQKFALDVQYIDNRSFLLDLKILLRTAYCVARRDGVSAHGEATAAPFTGSSSLGGSNGGC